jgi:hypothetical protein
MNTQYFYHICPPSPFLYALLHPTGTNTGQDLVYLPVFHFFKMTFCLFMMVIKSVVVTFLYIYMYICVYKCTYMCLYICLYMYSRYNTYVCMFWFIPSIILLHYTPFFL